MSNLKRLANFSEARYDECGLTLPQIIEKLVVCDIKAERKMLYQDFDGFDSSA